MTTGPSGPVPPAVPGALGETLTAQQIQDYLAAMLAWQRAFRAALDTVDAQASAAGDDGSALRADVTLAYALWQSIGRRVEDIIAVWDSGRLGRREREDVSTLLWGRLDDRSGGLPVSLGEACVLADALLTRLVGRVEHDRLGGGGLVLAETIRSALHRSRDLSEELGLPTDRVDQLTAELERLLVTSADPRQARSALAQLDAAVSTLERDLIVAAATGASLERAHDAVDARLRAAVAECDRVRRVAGECSRRVADPPRLAVPEARALGSVPPLGEDPSANRASLDAFAARIERVEAALRVASDRYDRPLDELAELAGLLTAYGDKAATWGYSADAALRELYDRSLAGLARVPCDLPAARALVESYRREVDSRQDGRRALRSAPTDQRGGRA